MLRLLSSCCLAAALLLLGLPLPAPAASFDAHVLDAIDGDTLRVLRGTTRVRVRLAEIDAPELDQPWGDFARHALAEKLGRLAVRIEEIGRDREGRVIGWVYNGKRNINHELVAEGVAWAYLRHLTDPALPDLEAKARADRIGLWAQEREDWIPPWNWRRGERNASRDFTPSQSSRRFRCGTKRICAQMWTCDEARFYFEQCGVGGLDENRDGQPCDSLCAPR